MIRRLLTEHLALSLSALAAVTVSAKVWSVAHGNPTSIAALTSSGNALTSLAGAFLAGLSVLGAVPLLFASGMLGEAMREGDNRTGPAVASVASLFLSAALASLQWFIVGAVMMAATVVISSALIAMRQSLTAHDKTVPWVLRESNNEVRSHWAVPLVAIVALACLATAFNDRPWLPLENVTTTSGRVTGYVLQQQGNNVLVMTNAGREIQIFGQAEIEKRAVCEDAGGDRRSLLSRIIWTKKANYPACP